MGPFLFKNYGILLCDSNSRKICKRQMHFENLAGITNSLCEKREQEWIKQMRSGPGVQMGSDKNNVVTEKPDHPYTDGNFTINLNHISDVTNGGHVLLVWQW